MPASTKQARKDKVWNTIQESLQKYSKVMFVNVDNVTSKQICIMRKALRAIDANMVMGKNVSICSPRSRPRGDTPFQLLIGSLDPDQEGHC